MRLLPYRRSGVKTYNGTATWALALAFSAAAALPAHAENHALIMWIGKYADPRANLPGIDLDAKAAKQIAALMRVPPANITELKNEQLTWRVMGQSISGLADRIKDGDKVFLYYSGHGGQMANATEGGRKCSEGLVAQDIQLYFDRDLESDLAKLGAKASQVVMMNDSCFSGGASTKQISNLVPKVLPVPLRKADAASAAGSSYNCGDAVNKNFLTKNLEVVPRVGARLLYIAAAADNEMSYASPEGSLATQAWAACLQDPAADSDRSGAINGEELRSCAQARIDGNKLGVQQHVTLSGTSTLPVSLGTTSAANAARLVVPSRVLQDIQAGADKAYTVALKPDKSSLRVGQDLLGFTVETNKPGYLTIFQVGTDGKSINILFPNSVDANNRLEAGQHSFPRPSWALKAAGPPGTDHLMALLSTEPKSYDDIVKKVGIFGTVSATRDRMKSLVVVSTGASGGKQGRYGASDVVQINEVP